MCVCLTESHSLCVCNCTPCQPLSFSSISPMLRRLSFFPWQRFVYPLSVTRNAHQQPNPSPYYPSISNSTFALALSLGTISYPLLSSCHMPMKCISSCDLLLKLLLLSAARANVRDTATTTMITENSTYSAYFIITTNFELSHKGFIYVLHTKEIHYQMCYVRFVRELILNWFQVNL